MDGARDRLEAALKRIRDPHGEGARACLTVYEATAHADAEAADRRLQAGRPLSPLDGRIVSIKDLFDVAGEPTRAGSRLLADAAPAKTDAPIVQRLRAAGAVIVAKTNMTEFAFTGVGMNPHFGTPGNARDRARIPGGSSSGAAISVTDGMAEIAIGTDTGGSTRIPAALNGLIGFKPTQARVPREGAFPLSPTLDTVGPIAHTITEVALADAVMAGENLAPIGGIDAASLRIGVMDGVVFDSLDETVAEALDHALSRLSSVVADLSDAEVSQPLEAVAAAARLGGMVPPEAYWVHRERMAQAAERIDPNVRARIQKGTLVSAADYIEIMHCRSQAMRAADVLFDRFDALLLPTTPIVAPRMADLEDPAHFSQANALLLRNTSVANFLGLPAISLPLASDGLPVGATLMGRHMADRRLFAIAAALEDVLAGR